MGDLNKFTNLLKQQTNLQVEMIMHEEIQAYMNATQMLASWKQDKLKASFDAIVNLANDSEELVRKKETTADYSLRILINVIRSYNEQVNATNNMRIVTPSLPTSPPADSAKT